MNKYLGNYETREEKNHLTLHQMDKFLTACTSFNTGLCEIYRLELIMISH